MDFECLVEKKKIDLSYNSLHDGNIEILVEVLEKSEVLEELNLWSNFIALADDKFTDALAQSRTLRVLSLGSNQLACKGIERLAESMKVNTSLQEIHLGDNNMGDDGAKSFADALKVNTALQVIGIYGNNIGDEGVEALAASFKTNHHVRTIWLHENKIGNAGAQHLVDALRDNYAIEQMFLIRNRITDSRIEGEITEILADATGRKSRAAKQRLLSAAEKNQDEIFLGNDYGERSWKDAEIAHLKAELRGKDEEMKAQEEEIAELKTVLRNQINHKDKEIAGLKAVLERPPRAPSPQSSPYVSKVYKKESIAPDNTASTSAEATVFEDDARDDNPATTLHFLSALE